MTELHPITPSPELIEEWIELSRPRKDYSPNPNVLATYAARWGADRELQFCLDWFHEFYKDETWVHKDLKTFMEARRPKSPSLKEQALQALENADGADHPVVATVLTADQHALIRKALEQLDD
jgi:hypothetical protein